MDVYFTHNLKNKGFGIQSGDKPYVTNPHGVDYKFIMWECIVSTPETTVILYNLNYLVYHGGVESVSIGEIKQNLRKSLVKLGCNMISRDPKLQLLLSDLEVVIRHPQDKKILMFLNILILRGMGNGW